MKLFLKRKKLQKWRSGSAHFTVLETAVMAAAVDLSQMAKHVASIIQKNVVDTADTAMIETEVAQKNHAIFSTLSCVDHL